MTTSNESTNKKVKNAVKVSEDGYIFDSRLEHYFYCLLKKNNIKFVLKPACELQPKFRYRGKSIRNIILTIDFYLPDYDLYVDPKGFDPKDSTLRFKIFRYLNFLTNKEPNIAFPHNKKECDALINDLIHGLEPDYPISRRGLRKKKCTK